MASELEGGTTEIDGAGGPGVAGRGADESAMGGRLADVTAGEQDGFVGKGGGQETAQFIVFRGGHKAPLVYRRGSRF